MRIAFDLDGTLDRAPLRELCVSMIEAGHTVHIVSGIFDEAGEWQREGAKIEKLIRMGILKQVNELPLQPGVFRFGPIEEEKYYWCPENVHLAFLHAMPAEKYDRDYRLADLGLRKGAYLEKHGIDLLIDDSEIYTTMAPKMCGATMLHVK